MKTLNAALKRIEDLQTALEIEHKEREFSDSVAAGFKAESDRLKDWKNIIEEVGDTEGMKICIERFLTSEAMQPIIDSWRREVAKRDTEIAKLEAELAELRGIITKIDDLTEEEGCSYADGLAVSFGSDEAADMFNKLIEQALSSDAGTDLLKRLEAAEAENTRLKTELAVMRHKAESARDSIILATDKSMDQEAWLGQALTDIEQALSSDTVKEVPTNG